MRERIRTLERHAPLAGEESGCPNLSSGLWCLGAPAVDARLGPRGLDPESVHEVKPATGAPVVRAAALAFMLRLTARRIEHAQASGQRFTRILWCWPERWRYETGHLYGPGLARLGLDPHNLLIVETARKTDALWALEEGLRSRSLALAVGVLEDVALTPARRLALAASEGATPCLLLTSAHAPASGGTATRWRIGLAPSAPHLFDPRAPGGACCRVALERNRGAKPGPETSHMLEWSDETHCFRVAADVAHRTPQPALTRHRTG